MIGGGERKRPRGLLKTTGRIQTCFRSRGCHRGLPPPHSPVRVLTTPPLLRYDRFACLAVLVVTAGGGAGVADCVGSLYGLYLTTVKSLPALVLIKYA